MSSRLFRAFTHIGVEERILNAAAFVGLIGVFLPWLSRELEGHIVVFSGVQFFTSFLGLVVALLHVCIMAVTIVPLCGGPSLLRRRYENIFRLVASLQAMVLTLAALSVLIHATFEFYRTELRFGIYVSLIGSTVASLYSFLRWQEQRRTEVHEFFHHPEQTQPIVERNEIRLPPPPPPPPPPPLAPEDHRLHSAIPVGVERSS